MRVLRPLRSVSSSLSRRSPVPTVGIALAVAFGTGSLRAQEVPEKEIPKANAVIKEVVRGAGNGGVLKDGRLLLFVAGRGVTRVDFDGNKLETLIAQGPDSNQIRGAGAPMRWPGDSVAMIDYARGRMMVLAPDGGPGRTIPVPRGMVFSFAAGGKSLFGAVQPQRVPPTNPSAPPPRLAYAVVRYGIESSSIDTLVQLMPATPVRPQQYGSGTGTMVVHIPMPYQAVDRWFAYDDGTLAIVRGPTYRVDLIGTDGARTQGTSLEYPKVGIEDDEKKQYLKEAKDRLSDIARANPRQPVQAFNWVEPANWPSQHPPFRLDAGMVKGSDERVWLPVRCASGWKANCYDVIDRSGARVARYRFPEHVSLLAASATAAYTIDRRNDEKGILQRHALP